MTYRSIGILGHRFGNGAAHLALLLAPLVGIGSSSAAEGDGQVPAASAEEKPGAAAEAAAPSEKDAERRALEAKFKATMDNVVFKGYFFEARDGQLGSPRDEKYTIRGVTRLSGDLWLLTTRIQYGERDLTVPVPVKVKWAGDTPVITLTDVGIPGIGTFTARVVVYDGFYAGTWSGGGHGGTTTGVIVKQDGAE